jgi:hypothetical protein
MLMEESCYLGRHLWNKTRTPELNFSDIDEETTIVSSPVSAVVLQIEEVHNQNFGVKTFWNAEAWKSSVGYV